jgi:hypothetical protein
MADHHTPGDAKRQEETPQYEAAMHLAVLKYRPVIVRIFDGSARAAYPYYTQANEEVLGVFAQLRRVTDLLPAQREEMVQGDTRRAWLRALHSVVAERCNGDAALADELTMDFLDKHGTLITKREHFRLEAEAARKAAAATANGKKPTPKA